MTRVTMLSANLGGFDRFIPPVPQEDVTFLSHCFTDANFPARRRIMSPRLQARIPKMFGWDMLPGADVYIWIDASFRMVEKHAAEWFVDELGTADIALFRHPNRHTIREEALHIQEKIKNQSPYLTERYEGEDLEGQLRAVLQFKEGYEDDTLYATMAFAYRPTQRIRFLLTDWWVHTSRFHAVDQLALPYLVWDHGVAVSLLPGDPYHHPMIEFTRGKTDV